MWSNTAGCLPRIAHFFGSSSEWSSHSGSPSQAKLICMHLPSLHWNWWPLHGTRFNFSLSGSSRKRGRKYWIYITMSISELSIKITHELPHNNKITTPPPLTTKKHYMVSTTTTIKKIWKIDYKSLTEKKRREHENRAEEEKKQPENTQQWNVECTHTSIIQMTGTLFGFDCLECICVVCGPVCICH